MLSVRFFFDRFLIRNVYVLFLFFWLMTIALYAPAYKAGFSADFQGLMYNHLQYGFWDFVNARGFAIKSLYQFTHLQLYFIIKWFSYHPLPWFLLLTGLHALNAALAFAFFNRIFRDFRISGAAVIAFFGAFFFLINPVITEVVIWKGCYHYLPGLLFQLLVMIGLRAFLLTRQYKYLLCILLVFFVSTYTLEVFYLTPWYALILILAYRWKGLITKEVSRKALGLAFGGMLLFFCLHLVVFRVLYGAWVAHYGTIGDFSVSAQELLPKFLKYSSTLFAMSAFYPKEQAASLYAFFSVPWVYYLSYALLFVLSLVALWRFKYLSSVLQLLFVLLGLYMLNIAIMSTIYFDDQMQLYNSRRCYNISLFGYMGLALFIFRFLWPGILRIFVVLLTGVLFIVLCRVKVYEWENAGIVHERILKTFQWQSAGTVLLLNIPAYFKEVRTFTASPYNEFQENLAVMGYDTVKGKVYPVSSYNMNALSDGAHVTVIDSMTLKVTLNQWATWWMYNYQGAFSYENELYRFDLTDPGHEYILHFKRKPANMVVVYQQGERWCKVDW